MDRISRVIESRPGLSQDEALKSLQTHPDFKLGTIIESITPRGNCWVAKLSEPKVAAGFSPFGDDEEKSDSDDSEDVAEDAVEDAVDDAKDEPKDDSKKDDSKSESSEIKEVLDLIHAIADKLGVDPTPDLGLDEEGLGDVPPGPPPPPADVAPKGPKGAPAPVRPQKDLPPKAAPLTGFASLVAEKRIPSFEVATKADISVKEAKADLDKTFPGYKVKQIRHDKTANVHRAKLALY